MERLPEWQGRGIAGAALRLVIRLVAARGERTLLVAYPGVDNPGSNALCRAAGFAHRGSGTMRLARWRAHVQHLGARHVAARSRRPRRPTSTSGSTKACSTRRCGGRTTSPHWSSRERAAARYSVAPDALELRIDADTPPWSPEFDERQPRLASADRPVLRAGRQPHRAAPLPRRAHRARAAARAPAAPAAVRRDRGADGRRAASGRDGGLLADRLRGPARRLRRDLHRRDLRLRDRRRRRLGRASA